LKARASLTFGAGFLLGALIWWASPLVTGEHEPWDAPIGYYALSLVVAGFLAALISPRHFWLAPLGVYFGQFVYAFAFLPGGPLWLLGLIFGLFYCILALLGGAGAFGLWRAFRRP
jgi:hypothetical protein